MSDSPNFEGLQCSRLQNQAVQEERKRFPLWTAWPQRWRHNDPLKHQ